MVLCDVKRGRWGIKEIIGCLLANDYYWDGVDSLSVGFATDILIHGMRERGDITVVECSYMQCKDE